MISEIKPIKSPIIVSILLTMLFLLCFVSQAQAVPAFARQMGVPCSTCHYQHFPLLNSFGRSFKASGFTMSGTPNIESDGFSLPSNLNAAIFSNLRYQKTNDKKVAGEHTSNDGEFILPGETSLFVGGRVSNNVGALIEGDVGAGGIGGAGFLASIKIPMVFDVSDTVKAEIIPFAAGLGPSYAFETLNTGAVGNHLINLVVPTAVSAQQYVTAGGNSYTEGDSEGISLVAAGSNFFVTGAAWSPNHSPADNFGTTASPDSQYLRLAITPMIGSWDTAFGVQYYGGKSNVVGDTTINPDPSGGDWSVVFTKAMAVDAQAQGMVGNMPLGVYLAYAEAAESKAGKEPNLYNPGSKKKSAVSIAAELGVFNGGKGTIQLAYRTAQTGDATYKDDNAATIGVTYLPTYNVQIALYQTAFSGKANSKAGIAAGMQAIDASGTGSSLTSLNLAVGF